MNAHIKRRHGEGSKGKVRKVYKKRASKLPVDTSRPIAGGEVSEDIPESMISSEVSKDIPVKPPSPIVDIRCDPPCTN